jgi:4-hydroxy-tetrahydrodipicolinate synthase
MDLDRPSLHGIVPPLPTPMDASGRLDLAAFERLVGLHLDAGVHGLWILGTTARFDLVTDADQLRIAEAAARVAAGRVPLVLNVSDQGTARTLERAALFDHLAYDAYAVLPPWYQRMTEAELDDYFVALAEGMARPLVIYNAPWVCNELSFGQVRRLARHPRIVGIKDVNPSLTRTLDWTRAERRADGFSYLHGNDLVGPSTATGSDGFVITVSDAFPEICVALYEAVESGDEETSWRLQAHLTRLTRAFEAGPRYLACLEAVLRHRGWLDRMLPAPLRSLGEEESRRIGRILDEVGVLPGGSRSTPRSEAVPARS